MAAAQKQVTEDLEIQKIKNLINEKFEQMQSLEHERDGINSEIKTCLDELEAKGVNRKAAKAAFKRYKMSEEERKGLDTSWALCCEAVNVVPQPDLFRPIDDDDDGQAEIE